MSYGGTAKAKWSCLQPPSPAIPLLPGWVPNPSSLLPSRPTRKSCGVGGCKFGLKEQGGGEEARWERCARNNRQGNRRDFGQGCCKKLLVVGKVEGSGVAPLPAEGWQLGEVAQGPAETWILAVLPAGIGFGGVRGIPGTLLRHPEDTWAPLSPPGMSPPGMSPPRMLPFPRLRSC